MLGRSARGVTHVSLRALKTQKSGLLANDQESQTALIIAETPRTNSVAAAVGVLVETVRVGENNEASSPETAYARDVCIIWFRDWQYAEPNAVVTS